MTDEALPEPDRIADAPHPRDTLQLFGQGDAEARFLDAFNAGRLHHAWLITGPEGVGKATLAWRIARFLVTTPDDEAGLFGEAPKPDTLDSDPENPVVRRMAAGAEPRFFLLRRAWDEKAKRLRAEITVDETRRLKSFFGLSAPDGGRRVVIVDAVDEMNINAANAFLKVLEEPPDATTILMVSHQPARLLPTIRSRCRALPCGTLSPEDLSSALAQAGYETETDQGPLAELSGGSVGGAIALSAEDGVALYARIAALLSDAPRMDRAAAVKLAEDAGSRGQEARRDLILRLIETFLARIARTGAGYPPIREAAPNETATLGRLAPSPSAGRVWATLHADLSARARHGLAVNLDPVSLILDMVLKINETAATIQTGR